MKQVSKLVKSMVSSLVILLLGGTVAALIIFNVIGDSKSGAQSVEKVLEYSYETPEITTDLTDGSFVRIQFQILTDGKDARKEISNREFQLRNILIKELANMDEESFKAGLSDLEDTIKTKLNEVMTKGEVTDVYTINKILQ